MKYQTNFHLTFSNETLTEYLKFLSDCERKTRKNHVRRISRFNLWMNNQQVAENLEKHRGNEKIAGGKLRESMRKFFVGISTTLELFNRWNDQFVNGKPFFWFFLKFTGKNLWSLFLINIVSPGKLVGKLKI